MKNNRFISFYFFYFIIYEMIYYLKETNLFEYFQEIQFVIFNLSNIKFTQILINIKK